MPEELGHEGREEREDHEDKPGRSDGGHALTGRPTSGGGPCGETRLTKESGDLQGLVVSEFPHTAPGVAGLGQRASEADVILHRLAFSCVTLPARFSQPAQQAVVSGVVVIQGFGGGPDALSSGGTKHVICRTFVLL